MTINAEETKREKARNLRYKKPIAKSCNLEFIQNMLSDILEECYNVQYYFDTDDDTLLNALDGDEDAEFEFKMMFSDLVSECEQMQEDLRDEYIPGYFDLFFVAADRGGEMWGFDEYEQDYYGLSSYEGKIANEAAIKKMRSLTKDQLIEAVQCCFGVYKAYVALQYRYDCLKAAMDILRDQNIGYMQMVKQIGELYEKANEATEGFKFDFGSGALKEFDRLLEQMPQEVWIQ